MSVSFCKQRLLILVSERHQNNGQGAGNEKQYEGPVPACHFGHVAEHDVGEDGGSEEVPEELGLRRESRGEGGIYKKRVKLMTA